MVRDEFQLARLRQGPRPRRRRSAAPEVTTLRVNPAAWRAALDLADGDVSRLVVESPTDVRVLNHKGRK